MLAIGKFLMRQSICTVALLSFSTAMAGQPSGTISKPVSVAIETTLATALPQIGQFAFDGDANTYFASANNPRTSDHFTLVFDQPVKAKSIAVITGRTDGSDLMVAGKLE